MHLSPATTTYRPSSLSHKLAREDKTILFYYSRTRKEEGHLALNHNGWGNKGENHLEMTEHKITLEFRSWKARQQIYCRTLKRREKILMTTTSFSVASVGGMNKIFHKITTALTKIMVNLSEASVSRSAYYINLQLSTFTLSFLVTHFLLPN